MGDLKDSDKAKQRVAPYVCWQCGYQVEYRPCFICETRAFAARMDERTYQGADDSGDGLGLSPEEERRRQEVLARPPEKRKRGPDGRFTKPTAEDDDE